MAVDYNACRFDRPEHVVAMDSSSEVLEQRYDAVAYASRSNALTHPGHLATVATLFGLAPPPVATCRFLDVGCSDGANLLPMAAALPEARFVGCDLSGQAIALARAAAAELGLSNVTFLQQDLAHAARVAGRVRLHQRARLLFVGAARGAREPARDGRAAASRRAA